MFRDLGYAPGDEHSDPVLQGQIDPMTRYEKDLNSETETKVSLYVMTSKAGSFTVSRARIFRSDTY